MQVYTLHYPIDADLLKDDPVLIKEGFNWPAALFTFLWALWNGMWLVAVLIFAVSTGLYFGLELAGADELVHIAASVGLSVIIGFSANDWQREKLHRRGYRFQGLVAADNPDAARRRWFSLYPPGGAASAG